ncbi:Conserved_hypothetical protein [Hexamita inflata]|uniref:Lipid-binding serum glycoprotein N-terminal domain-containing protein n=1 Tax=Hexamita inflata TaxID=28002 RepID=A0AA86Q0E8_9EUKA|nr:Conserved hypothetical protein [Hexamita inflata]
MKFVLIYMCYSFTFENSPVTMKDNGISVVITEKGFEDYIGRNIDFGNDFVKNLQIPDINLSLGLVNVMFTDIVVADMLFPRPQLDFNAQNRFVQFKFEEIMLDIKLQFRIQQQSYPYISDHGSGQLLITDTNMSLNLGANISKSCPNHINVDAQNFNMKVGELRINLNSSMDFLIESVIALLTDSMISVFEEKIAQFMRDAFVQIANNGLDENEELSTLKGIACYQSRHPIFFNKFKLFSSFKSIFVE